jgi:hypothetical protein
MSGSPNDGTVGRSTSPAIHECFTTAGKFADVWRGLAEYFPAMRALASIRCSQLSGLRSIFSSDADNRTAYQLLGALGFVQRRANRNRGLCVGIS